MLEMAGRRIQGKALIVTALFREHYSCTCMGTRLAGCELLLLLSKPYTYGFHAASCRYT